MDVEMKIQEPINKVTRKQKLKNYSTHPGSCITYKAGNFTDGFSTGLYPDLHFSKRNPKPKHRPFCTQVYDRKCVHASCNYKHTDDYLTFLMYSRTDRNFFSDIFSRVCKKRKQTSGSGSRYGGNTDRNSIHSLRTVRNVVF